MIKPEIYLVVYENRWDEAWWPIAAFPKKEEAEEYIKNQEDNKHLTWYWVDFFVKDMVEFAAL